MHDSFIPSHTHLQYTLGDSSVNDSCLYVYKPQDSLLYNPTCPLVFLVKKQPSQDILQGDAAEEELGLACLVSGYTLPHQNSQPGRRGRQTACSKVLSRCTRDTWSVTWRTLRLYTWPPGHGVSWLNKISHGGLWHNDRFTVWWEVPKESQVLAHR